MGSNQSSQQSNSDEHGIVVVNASRLDHSATEDDIPLPPRVLPILTLENNDIDSRRHKQEFQIDGRIWIEIVSSVDKYSNSRAELVATRQSQLHEKIILVDDHVQRFTDTYINDKHKAFARLNEDCRKVDEINKLLQKCTLQSELCVDILNKLNFLLPVESKLESIEL